jgi:hypothetical protein
VRGALGQRKHGLRWIIFGNERLLGCSNFAHFRIEPPVVMLLLDEIVEQASQRFGSIAFDRCGCAEPRMSGERSGAELDPAFALDPRERSGRGRRGAT